MRLLHARARRRTLQILAAGLLGLGVVATGGPASAAVSCSGAGCDNVGPKGAGCFGDDKTLASADGGHFKLRYSAACHAFWAYADQEMAPSFWDATFEIDMEHKNSAGTWVHVRTLSATHSVGEGDDWTNALGARTTAYRFRGFYDYTQGGGVEATSWVLGGNH